MLSPTHSTVVLRPASTVPVSPVAVTAPSSSARDSSTDIMRFVKADTSLQLCSVQHILHTASDDLSQ